jgi:hypothetical protein
VGRQPTATGLTMAQPSSLIVIVIGVLANLTLIVAVKHVCSSTGPVASAGMITRVVVKLAISVQCPSAKENRQSPPSRREKLG